MNSPRNGDLPDGWTLTKLGSICSKPQYGWTTSANRAGELPLLRTSDISGNGVNWETVPGCEDEPPEVEKYLLHDGDVVVSRAGSVGVSKLVEAPPRAVFASYLIRFRPREPISSKYVAYFMQSPAYWGAIADESRGNSIPNVNASKLKELQVPLPPVAEQERIVAALDDLLGRAGTAHERIKRAAQLVRRFRQAVLVAASSGALTADWRKDNSISENGADLLRRLELEPADGEEELPDTWAWTTLGEAAINHDGQRIPVKAADRKKRQGQYPYYGASGAIDTIDDYLFDGSYLLIGEDGANLLARATPVAFIASGRFWVNNHAHVVEPRPGSLLEYLEAVLNGTDLQDYVTGSAQPKLTQRNLNRLLIPLPPTDEQRAIVDRAKQMFDFADKLGTQLDAADEKADLTRRAALSSAFRGDLVQPEAALADKEGRRFEHADELLASLS